MISAVIFDLDGVVRHFDPARVARIERDHGLEPGALERHLFAEPHLSDVVTGRTTKRQWLETVGEQLGCPEATSAWGRSPARPDPEILELAASLREHGIVVGILTNGTDETPDDVAALGLDRIFDPIVSTSQVGHAKPDPRAFEHVRALLGMPAEEILFTDDSEHKLVGAAEIGMHTHHFTGVEGLRAALVRAGVSRAGA